MRSLVLILAVVASAGACSLQNFEPTGPLHPPLGLTAVSTNGGVLLSYWGLNDEQYFGGYIVYVGTSNEVYGRSNAFPAADGTFPTLRLTPFSYATRFTNQLRAAVSNIVPASGQYCAVAAWGTRDGVTSHLSGIVQVP